MDTLHLEVSVHFSFQGSTRGLAACSAGFFAFLLLWTSEPRDYVTYCQARGLSGNTSPRGECVCFILEDSAPLEAEDDYFPFSWSDSKWAHLVHYEEIFDSKLELLTPLWHAVLGLCCSAMVLPCSMTVHATRQLLTTTQQLITVVGP